MAEDDNPTVDDATEQTPLVSDRPSGPVRPPPRPSARSLASLGSHLRVRQATKGATIVNLLCLATFIAASATGFTLMPLTRIVEDIICRQYYDQPDGSPAEELCKADAVQSKLAIIIAVTGAAEAVVGCIAALPWGVMADRLGRKPVIVLALCGIALNLMCAMLVLWFANYLPIQLVWLSSLFQLIGGGQAIVAGGVLSIMSDVATEKERGNAFLRMHISSLTGNLASPALASLMMSRVGPWPCLGVAIGLIISGGVGFIFVPETAAKDKSSDDQSGGLQIGAQIREALGMLKSPSLIILLVICVMTSPVILSTLAFMVQFVSKRYSIPIYATGYIQTGYGVANAIFALVLLPVISKVLLNHNTGFLRIENEKERDLFLDKWSFGFLIVGTVVLALAPNLPVFCLGLFMMAAGSGYNSLLRSLISFHIKPEHRSRIFALVGMVEVVGNIYSQPMLAGLFSLGLKLGGLWIGLPYLGVTVLMTACLALLFFVRVPKGIEESVE